MGHHDWQHVGGIIKFKLISGIVLNSLSLSCRTYGHCCQLAHQVALLPCSISCQWRSERETFDHQGQAGGDRSNQ